MIFCSHVSDQKDCPTGLAAEGRALDKSAIRPALLPKSLKSTRQLPRIDRSIETSFYNTL
jgi:hypothetical protein